MLKRGLKGLAAFALVMTLSCLFAVEASAITVDGVGNNSLRVGADVYDLNDTASYTYDHVLASLRRGGSRYYFKMDSRWYDLLCDDINSFNDLTNPAKAVPAVDVRGWQLTYWYGSESTVEDFEPVTYTLNYGAGASGSVAGSAAQAVEHGESSTAVTAVADPGCHFVKWSDGSTANPRTDTDVTADITVEAEFATYVARRNNRLYSEVHGGLKGALDDAEHGDTVTLLRDYTLTEDVTVPAGVILLLPCSATDTGYTATGFNPDGTTTGTADLALLFRTLTVPAGKTVTIEGTVMVNAVTGRRNGGHLDQDITGGYSLIDLAGDVVVQSGGLLDVFGRVTGPGAVEALDGGSVGDLFVVRNWRGGSQALACHFEDIFPFNQYDLHNIEADMILNSGATYYGNVKMYADSCYHYTRFYQFAQEDGLIKLRSGATAVKSYDKNSGETIIVIDGGAETVNCELQVAGSYVRTNKFFYPVDGHIAFILNNGEYAINNKLKFLPGSALTVGADATLTIKPGAGLSIYEEFNDPPNEEDTEYPEREPALFSLDGDLVVEGAFGGLIDAGAGGRAITGADAILEVSSKEADGYYYGNYKVDYYYYTVDANLKRAAEPDLSWHYHPAGGNISDAILVADRPAGSDFIGLGGSQDAYGGYTFLLREGQREGKIKNINRGRYHFTIQGAVNAADPGDEISVGSGYYNESVTIDRSITLVGNCGDENIPGADIANPPILNGNGIGGSALHVWGASDVVIKGFGIMGYGGSGIVVEGSAPGVTADNIVVSNNTIMNVGQNRSGIEFCNVNNSEISSNHIFGSSLESGIKLAAHAPDAHSIMLSDITVNNNSVGGYPDYGILVQPVAHGGVNAAIEDVSITGNHISAGVRAVMLSRGGDSEATISNISIDGNELISKQTVIDIHGAVVNPTIINNIMETENADRGLSWVSGFATGVGNISGRGVFSNNTVNAAGGYLGYGVWIQGSSTADWIINDNVLNGPGWDGGTDCIHYGLPGTTVDISGNKIDDWYCGIKIIDVAADLNSNDIDRTAFGVSIEGNTEVLNLRYNRFMQEGNYSLLNYTGSEIDARYNYWGDPDGPIESSSNLWGDPVRYDPWYTNKACTQTSDGSSPLSKHMEYSTPGKDSTGKC